MRDRLRLSLAAFGGVALLALVLPYAPWHEQLTALGRWRQVAVLALIALAAWAIPRRRFAQDATKPDASLLGIGLLLLLEPFLHLLLMAWGTRAADPSLLGLLLPPPTTSGTHLLLALPLTVIVPPLIEEWAFRGRLFGLVRRRLGPGNAVTISALAFAVAHGSAVAALVALPIGILLGLIRVAGRGLGACVAVHAAHNLLFLLITGFAAVRHLPLILCVAGIWLIAIAVGWQYRTRLHHQRRIFLRSSLAMALCFLLLHDARRLHDELWLQAAAYQLAHPRNPLPLVLERIGPGQRHRILDRQRREQLAAALLAGPWMIPRHRLLPIVASLDHNSLLLQVADEPASAVTLTAELTDLPPGLPGIERIGRAICQHHRAAFRFLAMERWWLLPEWFPDDRDALVALLAETEGRDRTRLLAHIGEAYDRDESLACLLALPAEAVGPRDRLWVWKHCSDPEAVLRAAFADDPRRAEAWQLP